jgi:hypothetical protein
VSADTKTDWDARVSEIKANEAKMQKNNPLYRAIKEFQAKQTKYRKLGATDTEPRCIFESIIHKHARGENVEFAEPTPKDGNDGVNMWDLYSSKSGWVRANKALTTACKKVLEAIDKATLAQLRDVNEYFGYSLGQGW